MRKMRTATGILLAGILLWGCGEQRLDTGDGMTAEAAGAVASDVEVLKDGSILETLVEDFSGDYYNEEGLRNMVLSEVAEYNKGHGEAGISVDRMEQKDGAMTLQIKYPSADAYSEYNTDEYNKKSLFCGTVKQAYDAGYSLDISMQDTKGEKTIGREELLEMGDQNILIAGNPMCVKVAGKIQYVSSNVTVNGKSEARFAGDDETASEKYYVIYK